MTTLIFYILTLSASIERNDRIYYVNRIELNHVYDEEGKLVLDQMIYYDKNDNVMDWLLVKDGRKTDEDVKVILERMNEFYTPVWVGSVLTPKKKGERWVAKFYFEDKFFIVHSDVYIETWTQYDPELLNQDRMPKDKRKTFLHQKDSILYSLLRRTTEIK